MEDRSEGDLLRYALSQEWVCFCLWTQTCCKVPRGVTVSDSEISRERKTKQERTKTFFALQIRHARFLTLPSACTTSGANSIPNLGAIS